MFVLIKTTGVFGALYMFLVGIKGMSSAIKHMGADVADSIFTATSDPFIALFIGVFSTVLFQSSSTTTSLIVGMVSSGSLGLAGAVPMIMGANIGTTVTNTIVSMGHINRGHEFKRAFAASTVHDFFNIIAVIILFPLEMMFHGIQRSAEWFASLLFGKIHNVDVLQAKSPIKTAVKSGAGVLSLKQIFPFTLGANIGTTVTALLAALTGTVSALIAAISHLLFNIFGIIIIYGAPFLRAIPLKCAELIAEYSLKNKLIPLGYLLVMFVLIPLTIILTGS